MTDDPIKTVKRLAGEGRLFDAVDFARTAAAKADAPEALRIEEVTLLARMASTEAAIEAYRDYDLHISPSAAARALGARLTKDRGLAADDPALLRESRDAYLAVAEAAGESDEGRLRREHAGVNAITLSRLIGDMAPVEALARGLVAATPADSYWSWATRAELLAATGARGRDVRRALVAAMAAKGADLTAAAVTRRQLRVLGQPDEVLRPLIPPPVLHYAGHMIAPESARNGRILAGAEATLAARIEAALERIGPESVYGSFASGADILIAEWALRAGLSVRLFAPFALEAFLDSSVRPSGGGWEARARACLAHERAETTFMTADAPVAGDDEAFAASSRHAMGAAILRAFAIGAEPRQLLVWDLAPQTGVAGAAADGAAWRRSGWAQDIVDVIDLGDGTSAQIDRTPPARERCSIVFGDVKAFSTLAETQLPGFVDHVMGAVAAAFEATAARYGEDALRYRNTWGDGIFAVFRTAAAASVFALDLQARMSALPLAALGLPEGLAIRLGMHFGVVHRRRDPVTGVLNCFGEAVARAARIEPVTTAGRVFVTEEFAAELALDPDRPVRMEYVGQVDAAKSYGEFRLFRISPRRASSEAGAGVSG